MIFFDPIIFNYQTVMLHFKYVVPLKPMTAHFQVRTFEVQTLFQVVYYTLVAIDLKLVVLPLKLNLLKHSLGQFIIGHSFTKAQWIR